MATKIQFVADCKLKQEHTETEIWVEGHSSWDSAAELNGGAEWNWVKRTEQRLEAPQNPQRSRQGETQRVTTGRSRAISALSSLSELCSDPTEEGAPNLFVFLCAYAQERLGILRRKNPTRFESNESSFNFSEKLKLGKSMLPQFQM